MLVVALALAACTHGASSVATQGPTPSGPETPPPPRTVVINKGGTHVYPLSKIAPGDEVVCIAGGGGGVVSDQGEGVGASSGFRARAAGSTSRAPSTGRMSERPVTREPLAGMRCI